MLELLIAATGMELSKLVLEQVLNLGKSALEDYVKDFFKDCIQSGVARANAETLKKPMAEAIGFFIKRFIKELQFNDVPDTSIEHHYKAAIKQFVRDQAVRPILGKAFEKDCKQIDYKQLEQIWTQQYTADGWRFPSGEFDWRRVAKEYVLEVQGIIKVNAELRSLLNTELLEDIARNTAQLSPGFDVEKYRKSLQCSYGYLKLYTLDSTDRADNIKLWNLFVEQTVREALPPMRYELPLDLKRQLQEQGQLEDLSPEALEHYRREYFEQPARKVLEAVAESQRAVILGDPGAGKSSLLQYLALNWVEGKAETLPLLIELREYVLAQSANFLEFLHCGRGVDWQFDQQQLHQHLLENSTLVMFDGLDEVFDRPTQSAVIDDIIRFAQQYPQAKVLVTSRIIGYNPERFQHAGFRQFTIQPLDKTEIHEFIDRWYDLAMGSDSDKVRLKQRLKDAIENSKAIANLADNPLLLTMMAILNRRQELPRDRANLYDQASQVLLYHWDVDYKKFPRDAIGRREKQEILRLIAYEMQAGEEGLKGNLIGVDRLTRILTDYLRDQGFSEPREKADVLIQQLRERNFILCHRGADTYGFLHRTFLEYFCAVEIKERFNKRGVEGGISFEQLRDEFFGQHWQDEAWHEVLQLICSMIDAKFTEYLVDFLMVREIDCTKFLDEDSKLKKAGLWNLLLAANCLAEVRTQSTILPVANQLLYILKQLIEAESNIQLSRIAVKAVFKVIAEHYQDDTQTLPWLQDCVRQGNKPLEVLLEATGAIAKYYQGNPQTLPWLQDCMQRGKNQFVQSSAMLAICEHYRDTQTWSKVRAWIQSNRVNISYDDKNFVSWLTEYFQQNSNAFVRILGIEIIAQYCQDDPQTLLWLQELVKQNDHPDVRGAAMKTLAKYYRANAQVLPFLSDFTQDENSFVRVAAVGAITEYYQNGSQALLWLQNCVHQSAPLDVQWAAVKVISEHFSQEPEVFDWFYYVAQNESLNNNKLIESPNPRQAALESLLTHYPAHPKTIALLHDRALNDPDEQLREWAQQQLEKLEKS